MFRKMLLAIVAVGAIGLSLGISSTAEAGHGCRRSYYGGHGGYYGGHGNYHRSYYHSGYHGYGGRSYYGPSYSPYYGGYGHHHGYGGSGVSFSIGF